MFRLYWHKYFKLQSCAADCQQTDESIESQDGHHPPFDPFLPFAL